MFKRFIGFGQKRFQSLNTRQKLLLGFSVPLLLMVLIGIVVNSSIGKLVDDTKQVQHTHEEIAGGQELINLMIDMETGERGFLITGKEHFLDPFKSAKSEWDDKISRLTSLVSDNPAQVERLNTIDQL